MSREYDKRRYRELDAEQKALEKEREEIACKMKDLLYGEGMTDRKRRLAKKYDKVSFTNSFFCFLCPILFLFENSLLSLKIKCWPIRKIYIILRQKYTAEILRLNERIRMISSSKTSYLYQKGPLGCGG